MGQSIIDTERVISSTLGMILETIQRLKPILETASFNRNEKREIVRNRSNLVPFAY